LNPQTLQEKNQKLLQFDLRYLDKNITPLAGVDEAGRGPLAGPVVAASVIIKNPHFNARIDDSKKLSPKAREIAFREILTKCVISTGIVEHTRIDQINIYYASIEAMQTAVNTLDERPRLALVDGPLDLNLICDYDNVVKGDAQSLSIACASIVAKVARDRLMLSYHERYPQYGFDQHKGYGTKQHLEALKNFGACEIHRKSFHPVAAVLPENQRETA